MQDHVQEDDIQLFSVKPRKKARRARETIDVSTSVARRGSDEAGMIADVDVAKTEKNVEKDTGVGLDSFEGLGVSEHLCAVLDGLGIVEPTAVQRGCIPAIMEGRNVIGVAQTGSGKTAAFALPVLHRLAKNPYGVFNLVLTPTRELAFQIADQYKAFGAGQNV